MVPRLIPNPQKRLPLLKMTLQSQIRRMFKLLVMKLYHKPLISRRKMLQVYVGGEGQNLREAKILELSKRNRDLNLALEKERRCSSKWKHQLQIVKEELLKKIEEEERGNSDVNKSEKEAKETQEWKEKYNQTNAKLLEIQASRAILSAEVSKLQHALHREVGDHIPISKVLEEGGDWKGRSQQICILKDKIADLKSKLQKQSANVVEHNHNDNFDSAQKREYEQISAKFLACREDLKNTRQKLSAILARRNVLENELKVAKEKMSLLVGKSDNDDRLIAALRLELEAQRQGQGPTLYGQKVGGPLSLDLVQRQHRLAASFQELKRHCYQQELQIQAQAELIEYLRAIASSQHEEEVMKDNSYDVVNGTSELSMTSKSSLLSQFDPKELLELQ
ncbi:hypothetical protein KP509_19G013300 [Ceratopteris richardii]|uniref:Uncharacterized protein n=1 Tax=Ceratopteris richardii TaxID=49495 RepID=A0A8T2SLK4_CERRI|nr:hypothetical protein KP509_19G013300 [Ceratopteris richardii]KAH7351755.1 hypothetical protein KP509_19G013300 [Ceratopteris richardii]KAH7351759.1 hypothetical protein KP509_19G013300 [Ceratopteris richardii]KAH7351764.1 hypothetical protein KP509_19G013300 [Ceratopteris richardii]